MLMNTEQIIISICKQVNTSLQKQDKHKVKKSTLADYCDMVRDGVQTDTQHFTERVV